MRNFRITYIRIKLLWFGIFFSFFCYRRFTQQQYWSWMPHNQIPDLWDFLLVILSNCQINERSVQQQKKGKKIYQHLCINNVNVHIMILSVFRNLFDWKDCTFLWCVWESNQDKLHIRCLHRNYITHFFLSFFFCLSTWNVIFHHWKLHWAFLKQFKEMRYEFSYKEISQEMQIFQENFYQQSLQGWIVYDTNSKILIIL